MLPLAPQRWTPPHFDHDVRGYLNDTLSHSWIGRASQDGSLFLPWPPRSPDLSPCDFFLCCYVKDHVFVPLMPLDLAELRQRIEHAVAGIDDQMLVRVWQEWIIGSMSAESPTVGIWNTCKVCTETGWLVSNALNLVMKPLAVELSSIY